jgi:hypothetical protein
MKRRTGSVFAGLAWLVALASFNWYLTAPAVAQSSAQHQAVAVPRSIDIETIDQGWISYFRYGDPDFMGVDMLIQDQSTWEWFWAEHTSGMESPPPLPDVDFTGEAVIVTILGFQTTGGGPSIEVLELNVGPGSLHVHIEDDEMPGPLDIITNPFHIVRVGMTDVPSVVFEHQCP